jgi:hypothetical protein
MAEEQVNVPASEAGLGKAPAPEQPKQTTEPAQGMGPAHNDGTPFPDRPSSPTDQAASTTDANSGSQVASLDSQLIGEARSLGIDTSNFKTEQEINDAILAYDMQQMNAQSAPQYTQQPMQQPVPQQYEQQPEVQPQQQQQEPANPFVELDPDTMDETTYKALSGMQNAMRDMQQQNQALQQQYQQAMFNEYMTRMMPHVQTVDSRMYNSSTQVGQNLTAMLLETAEGIRQTRASRGRQVSDAEAINAAHRMLQQQLGLANNPITDQMIGVPGNSNQQVDMSNDPDAAAKKVIRSFIPDSEPPNEDLTGYFPDMPG